MQEPLGQILQNIDSEPRKVPGSRMLLFDRLIDEDETVQDTNAISSDGDGRFYDRPELVASIEREVFKLLNTRTVIKRDEYEILIQDEINFALPEMYGLPEFSLYEGANSMNWPLIIQHCQLIIGYYEPRLKNIQVIIDEFDQQQQTLTVHLTADLAVPEFTEEITFPLNISLMSS
jgi:type VI secretion system lysozyme-like protein